MAFLIFTSPCYIFCQEDSSATRDDLLTTVNIGNVELISLEADIRLIFGFYLQITGGRNLIPLESDYIPKWSRDYSIGVIYKPFKSFTPILSIRYGYSAWENNKSDPAYYLLLPPESAHLFCYSFGAELRTAKNMYSGLSIGHISWKYSNGTRMNRNGVQFYTGISIW